MPFTSTEYAVQSCKFITECVLSNFGAFLFVQGRAALALPYFHPQSEITCLEIRRKTNNETRGHPSQGRQVYFRVIFLPVVSQLSCHNLEGSCDQEGSENTCP